MSGENNKVYELKYIEGNEYELLSYGVLIAVIYLQKDTYSFDIKQLIDNYNKSN